MFAFYEEYSFVANNQNALEISLMFVSKLINGLLNERINKDSLESQQ